MEGYVHVPWQAWHYPATYTVLHEGASLITRGEAQEGNRGASGPAPHMPACLHACERAHPPQVQHVGLLRLDWWDAARQVDSTSEPEGRCFFISMLLRWNGQRHTYCGTVPYCVPVMPSQRSNPIPKEPEPASSLRHQIGPAAIVNTDAARLANIQACR